MDSTNVPLLRNVRFLRLWIGQGTSFVGDAVSMVALVVLVVEITGSASAVGGALVARLLPTIASPLAGVLADRVDRRVILVASDLARAVLILGLVSAILLSTVPLPHPHRESEEEEGFVRELRSGFGYLIGARVPLAIVVGAFLTILTINATVPAEVFLARETFGAGDAGYGLLVSLWGGGMVLGSAMMAVLGDRINLVL